MELKILVGEDVRNGLASILHALIALRPISINIYIN